MAGRRWTAEEDETVRVEYRYVPLRDLAKKLKRTEGAIIARACGMRLDMPVIEFDCANCGRHVVTEGVHANGQMDTRTRYCCKECHDRYSVRPRNRGSFASLQHYQAWEKFTNG